MLIFQQFKFMHVKDILLNDNYIHGAPMSTGPYPSITAVDICLNFG